MRLGRFEVVDRIGEGGSGVVYRARADGRLFAVKLLQKGDPASALRFERERRLLDQLGEGEGFVPLVDAGEAPEGLWIAMPYIAGGTLRERLARRGRIPHDEAVPLIAAIARAVGRAHALGIVHRDLKPTNVLFTEQDRPLVSDLGLGKHFARGQARDSVSMSRTGDFRGTLGYVPPEQMLDAKAATPQGDVFALGAILFECLAGECAIPGGSGLEVAQNALEGRTKPLRLLRPHAPRWLRRVVGRALAAAPGKRFADGAAFARALDAAGSQGVLAAALDAAASIPAAALVSAAALSVLTLVGVGLLALRGPAAPPAAALARDALARAEAREGARDLDAALVELGKAVELDPALARAWTRRAVLRARRHDAKGALSDAERATALEPRSPEAWCAAGVAREEALDRPGAIDAFSKAIDLDGSCALAWAGRAWSRCFADDRLGVEDADTAVALAPSLVEARVVRALRRLLSHDWKGSLGEAAAALASDPRCARAIALRGATRVWTGDAAGTDECTRAIELDSRDATVWMCRAVALMCADRPESALEDFSRALELDPGHLWSLIWRSRARHMSGDIAGALDDADRAIRLAPRSARPWLARGDAHVSARDIAATLADTDKALELDPTNASAHIVRALAHLNVADFDRALVECDEALRLDAKSSPAWFGRANIAFARRDYPRARRDAQQALETARDALRERSARSLLVEIDRVTATGAGERPPR